MNVKQILIDGQEQNPQIKIEIPKSTVRPLIVGIAEAAAN